MKQKRPMTVRLASINAGATTNILLPLALLAVALASAAVMSCAPRAAWAQTPADPIFSQSGYTRSIHENAAAGTPVGDPVRASDPGQALTYTLGGRDAASFTVDANTGQLRVGSGTVLDFETKSRYSLTVTATDPTGLSAAADVGINVVDLDEAADLGTVEFVVGSSGANYGFLQGSYGTLNSGAFPGELFDSGPDRTVAEFREDPDGFWYLRYSGVHGRRTGSPMKPASSRHHPGQRRPTKTGRTGREFVLGGFITERQGSNRLKLDPPIPSRDFESRSGETVRVEFRGGISASRIPR